MFLNRIEVLNNNDLQILFVINDNLITLEDYNKKLRGVAKDNSKFVDIQGIIIGISFLEALENDLTMQHEVNHIFVFKPTFSKYTEVDEIYMGVTKLSILNEEIWEKLCELLD